VISKGSGFAGQSRVRNCRPFDSNPRSHWESCNDRDGQSLLCECILLDGRERFTTRAQTRRRSEGRQSLWLRSSHYEQRIDADQCYAQCFLQRPQNGTDDYHCRQSHRLEALKAKRFTSPNSSQYPVGIYFLIKCCHLQFRSAVAVRDAEFSPQLG
jgi:hypothetical protein